MNKNINNHPMSFPKFVVGNLPHLNMQKGDPQQKPLGMTTLCNVRCEPDKKGFTLIELLVVVLIIGILAAVALPQYQYAVLKAKFNNVYQVAQNMKKAADLYYLEHGVRKDNLYRELDINYSGSCKGSGAGFICEEGFRLDMDPTLIYIIYDPTVNTKDSLALSTGTIEQLFLSSTFPNKFIMNLDLRTGETSCAGGNTSLCRKLTNNL